MINLILIIACSGLNTSQTPSVATIRNSSWSHKSIALISGSDIIKSAENIYETKTKIDSLKLVNCEEKTYVAMVFWPIEA